MISRHLDYPPDAPVEQLGLAALDDLLDRGDLQDWTRLTRAVAADPYGPLAERVLGLIDAHAMYGTSRLWRGWIERLRDRCQLEPVAGGAAPVGGETAPVGGGAAPVPVQAASVADPEPSPMTSPTPLRGLRERAGLTQQQVAAVMGVAQPDLSRLERRADAKLSTLRAYAEATGARLRLMAELGRDQVEVRLGADPDPPP